METQTSPYAKNQHQCFSAFIKVLIEKFKPEQIYSFGKNYVLTEKSGCFNASTVDQHYHHFLLMVTETVTRIEHEVQDFANAHYRFGTITILVHGKETIAGAVKANNRFFTTVYTKGQIIYSQDGMAQPELINSFNPAQSAIKAQKHFDHRIPLAKAFLTCANECLAEQQYGVAVFMLHQVVEQSSIALIRIYLAYRSDIHNLYRQLNLCNCFSSAPTELFLLGKAENKRLFDVLVKSYSGARYNDDFKVSQADAEQLLVIASTFVKLTETMCVKKIEMLGGEAVSYKQLLAESEVSHD